MFVCTNCCLLALPDEGLKKHVSRAGLQSGPSCRWVKAGFDERCSCRNATSNPFLERTIRSQSYQSRLWILAIPLFQWSLNCSKLISIHICTSSDPDSSPTSRHSVLLVA